MLMKSNKMQANLSINVGACIHRWIRKAEWVCMSVLFGDDAVKIYIDGKQEAKVLVPLRARKAKR